MITTGKILKALLILLISTAFLTAQNQHYRIHVDHVYPSSSKDYEKIESYVMVASAAESALEFEKQAEANRQLLGEDARKLWDELMQYVTKVEYIEGNMMPNLSYNPSK